MPDGSVIGSVSGPLRELPADVQSALVLNPHLEKVPYNPVRDFAGTVSRIVTLTPTIKALHLALDKPIASS